MLKNRALRITSLFLIVVLSFIACTQDELEIVEEQEEQINFPKIRGRIITPYAMQDRPKVYGDLMNYLSRSMAKSQSGIQLDTTQINVVDTDQYTSYTFKIRQDSLERQYLLRNFMLTVVNDTTMIQHIVEYPVLSNGAINMEGMSWQRLYGDDLLNLAQPKCGGTITTWYSYEYCYTVACKNGHTDTNECDYSKPDYTGTESGPFTYCSTRWASIDIDEEPCASIDSGNGSNGGGGAIPPDPDPLPEEGDIIVPIDPIDPDEPDLCLSGGDGGCIDLDDRDLVQPVDKAQEYLNMLLKNDDLKTNILRLQNELQTSSYETGFSLSTSFADEKKPLTENTPLTLATHQADPADPNNIDIPFDMDVKVSAHMHQKSTTTTSNTGITITESVLDITPMFSPNDIHKFNSNMKYVYNSLRAGYDPDEIAAILDGFCDIVVTEKGNYMIKYNGTGEELTDIDVGDKDSTDPAVHARYQAVMIKYDKLVKQNPENGIVDFIDFLSPGNNFEVYKFDLTGNITQLN